MDDDRGVMIPAQTMYDLSKDWYRTRMDIDWEPPTPEQAQAAFARHGLIGEFWRLS